ncbi:MAG: alpha/beta hydrolase family protein [Roseateles sp.]|uniref:alpha/beta hydrolase family protein n=1 Tax=Roseateles sp. TaxID=1971397 RepID=UPI004035EE19
MRMIPRLLMSLALPLALSAPAQTLSFLEVLDRPDRPQPDHRLAYGDAPQQFGELWLPKGPGPHPVALMIHGGCWQASLPGPELLAFQADALRAAGVAVWSISYRRVGHPGGGYPGTFDDVARGADRLLTLARRYPLDLKRLVATGHSAGGHLALWAAARPRIAASSPLKAAAPLPVPAVVAVAGIPDLAFASRNKLCGTSVDQLLGSAPTTALLSDTSPLALLPLRVPQALMQGTQDRIVPPAASDGYRTQAAELGDTVEVVNLDGAGHFELIAPWTPAGRQVVERIVRAVR